MIDILYLTNNEIDGAESYQLSLTYSKRGVIIQHLTFLDNIYQT